MVKIIEPQEKARWRIQIYDLKEKKTRTISLTDHTDYTLDDITEKVKETFK